MPTVRTFDNTDIKEQIKKAPKIIQQYIKSQDNCYQTADQNVRLSLAKIRKQATDFLKDFSTNKDGE